MKRAQQPERFYYDITIEHDPAHTDDRHYMKSKAEKTIYMESPLMEDPGEYNMSVCKFSINTEAIPVFIPELNGLQYKNDIANKQDKLTAGENITIENNVISSTGGTQVQADWNQTNVEAVDYIKNKPTIPDMANYYTKQEIDNKFSEVETTLSQI